uniref:Uncharacterized protein n=1 Tax=Lepeophtheirus salmonis TaxID=72036 RepID=A0A0K2TGW8_LEPSM
MSDGVDNSPLLIMSMNLLMSICFSSETATSRCSCRGISQGTLFDLLSCFQDLPDTDVVVGSVELSVTNEYFFNVVGLEHYMQYVDEVFICKMEVADF